NRNDFTLSSLKAGRAQREQGRFLFAARVIRKAGLLNGETEFARTATRRRGVHNFRRSTHDILRRSKYKNVGAPAMAVIAPTGNCVGATMVRARVSAMTMAIAPPSAEVGISTR